MATALNAKTQYVTAANGVRFAYRHIGPDFEGSGKVPLVMHMHYRANMDLWDPLLLSTLSSTRPVLIFDQSGVGRSSGTVPTTYQAWADNLIALTTALGLTEIDLLGFSMGGIAVQYVALTSPHLVRRLILAGTTASVPGVKKYDDITSLVGSRQQAPPEPIKALTNASSESIPEGKKALAYSFFYDDDQGRADFEKYWSRILQRKVDDEEPILTLLEREGTMNQWQTAVNVNAPDAEGKGSFDRLGELKMPVLVANGDNDVLIPSSRSWELYRLIENAALIMYPKAGHGFLWQYAEMFGRHVSQFLDSEVFGGLGASKL